MQPIKVLVVDDSELSRSIIISAMSDNSEIQVIGEAENGEQSLHMVKELKPDLVTMDLEMPIMGGLEAIIQIMSTNAVPILVISGHKSDENVYKALYNGALDVIDKSDIGDDNEGLIRKVRILSKVKVVKHIQGVNLTQKMGSLLNKTQRKTSSSMKMIAIASSTGGPKALSAVLSMLPENLPCSVVVAQHMTDGFIAGLAEWLDTVTKFSVKEGVEQEALTRGTVYLSPTEKNMIVNRQKRIELVEKKDNEIYNPSCNTLLSSVADVFGADAIGIILTGMGDDGAAGIKAIKENGGGTIAQDEVSSIVFGMPKVAIDSGYVDMILPLNEIGSEIERLLH